MNKAIVICYTGRAIGPDAVSAIQQIISGTCDADPENVTIMAFDEESIAKALLKKGAESLKISFTEAPRVKHTTDSVCITFNPEDCKEKLRIAKYIKESLHCDLKDAKDMADCGRIYVPRIWDDRKMYAFIKDLCAYKVIMTGDTEDVVMMQAAIFLNETYGTKDSIDLVKDFAAATYHSHTNSADEKEQALLAAVDLFKNNPASATRWVSSELVNVINSL